MESNAALAASVGIALTLGVTGLTLIACGLAIRGAGEAEIVSGAPYLAGGDSARLNRWIGLRMTALGAGALAAALVSFSWAFLAVPVLGLFGVAGSIAVALIVAGPKGAATVDDPSRRELRNLREPAKPADRLAETEHQRVDRAG